MGSTFAPAIRLAGPCHTLASDRPKVARPVAPAADLRIDGWLVQPSLNLVSRDDLRVRLRAQLMDLLLCLASRPGKVILKDELVAEVWEGRWIAQSALSRCVAELRAALGDEAHRPHVIETITKRGYRLIAAVEVVPPPEAQPVRVVRGATDVHARTGSPPAEIAAAMDVAAAAPVGTPRSLWQRLKLVARCLS